LQFLGAKKARLGCPFNVCDFQAIATIIMTLMHLEAKFLVKALATVQLNAASESDCVLQMPG